VASFPATTTPRHQGFTKNISKEEIVSKIFNFGAISESIFKHLYERQNQIDTADPTNLAGGSNPENIHQDPFHAG
jgi:hypothetical protein